MSPARPATRLAARPRARGVAVAVAAGYCLVLGVGGAYPLPTAVGVALAAALLLDAAILWSRARAWRRQAPRLKVEPNPVQAGDTVTLTWLGLGPADAEMVQPLPPSFHTLTDVTQAAVLVEAAHRGVFDLPRAEARLMGPLGSALVRAWFPPGPRVVVWPATAPVAPHRRSADHDESAGRAGLARPSPEDATVREYRTGDEWRRIHWRSTARRGQLMTRAEEPSHPPVAHVRAAFGPGADDDAAELAIELAASAILALGDVGFQVLLTAGGATASGPWTGLFDRLAALDPVAADRADLTDALGLVWDSARDAPAPADPPGSPALGRAHLPGASVARGRSGSPAPGGARLPGSSVARGSSGSPAPGRALRVVAAAGFPADRLVGVLPPGGPALALLVGDVPAGWAERFDKAGWATASLAGGTSLERAADLASAELAQLAGSRA